MSGIYGIFRFDGAPVDPGWIQQMHSAMAYYGPDGGNTMLDGSIGLGHLLHHLNPEDAFASQPSRGERGPLVCTARLDNRDSLLQSFAIPASEFPRTSDAHLITLAWNRWGTDLAPHLEGDWSLAAWNPREKKLFLARDACGLSTLYYCKGDGFLAFASSMKALLAIPCVIDQPEEANLAEVLLNTYLQPELTAFKNIFRLLGAQTLSVKANGLCSTQTFWSPEYREPIRYRRDEDYEEAYLELFTRAVQSCLRSQKPIAASLSGGRDSGSVVALAAPLLAAQGRSLTAYTSVPCLPPDGAQGRSLGNEWEPAHNIARMAGPNVQHIAIDAADYRVLQGINHLLDVHSGVNGAAVNHFWLQAISEAAARQGAGVLLSGQMGNYSVSWTGSGSLMLALRRKDWATALHLLSHTESNAWLLIKRKILKPLLAPATYLSHILPPPSARDINQVSAIQPSFIENLDSRSALRRAALGSIKSPSGIPAFQIFSAFMDAREILLSARYRVANQLPTEISAWHRVQSLDPTANQQLVEFLLRVPDSQFVKEGQGCSLFKRAFRNKLPEDVLAGKRKGLQSADIGHRILRELPDFQQCIADFASIPAASKILNLSAMDQCLRDLTSSVNPESTSNSAHILLKGIAVGLFLQRHTNS
jgi:asparagine synthase (glutamine-hydrolysing)